MTWKLVLVGATLALLLWLSGGSPQEAPRLELTILHTNDVHSHYLPPADGGPGGAARLATVVRQVRAEATHTLLVDAGDQFQGTLLFTVGGPVVVADVMKAIGYDVMALGNHEFDLGPAGLAAFIDKVPFPVLSANTDATSEPLLDGKIRPFDVFLLDGELVGAFGLTTENTAYASSPGERIVFEPIARRARTVVAMLERQGVNRIVAVTHLGYEEDLALAATVAGIDVIVGGHSHTELVPGAAERGYPTWATSSTGDPVVIVTAGTGGKALGRLDLVFDEAGHIADATGAPILLSADVEEDPGIVRLLAPYAAAADGLLAETVGSSRVDLDGERARVRSAETNLGNLIADAMLAKTRGLGANVGLMNGGGIRASVPSGEITMGKVLEVLPFGNQITTVCVRGRDLTAALENGVSQAESGAGRFPQVAGVRFTYDPAAPAGGRVRAVELWDRATQAYRALLPDEGVVIATNDFLAGGGDGYDALASGSRYDTGWLLSDALAEYVAAQSPVAIEIEGRIQTVGGR